MKTILAIIILCSVCYAETPAVNKLSERIRKVAPIEGVAADPLQTKDKWRIDFKIEATPEQRSNAAAIITTWTAKDWEKTPKEKRADKYKARTDVIGSSILRYTVIIELETDPVKRAKAEAKLTAAKQALKTESDKIESEDPDE